MNETVNRPAHWTRSSWAVFLLSVSSICLQLSLIRILSVTRFYHFTFFVISIALLGYGTSGTFLLFVRRRWSAAYGTAMFWCSLAVPTLGLISLQAALRLPIDSQYLFQTPEQILFFVLSNILFVVPFFLVATVIGLSLSYHSDKSGVLYGVSLVGTGAGALLILLLMFHLPEETLLQVSMIPACCAAVFWLAGRRFRILSAVAGALLVVFSIGRPPEYFLEPYKGLAQLRRWAAQGEAQLVLSRHSPRARIDVFESPLLHFTLFAGVNTTQPPPPQFALLQDGYFSGTVFRINHADQAPILDQTPGSVPYRLRPQSSCLLLGETGGTNVWLARRFSARRITVVQPDPQIIEILNGPLADASGSVLKQPHTEVVCEAPRLFLQSTSESYDVIQIVSAEEMAAESRGVTGLREDYLLTVEGMQAAWNRLLPGGILVISRGIQTPPRDSLKLITILRAALLKQGVNNPGAHLVLLQNYLADTLLLFRNEPSEKDLAEIRDIAAQLALDIRWEGDAAEPAPPTAGGLPSISEDVSSLFADAENFTRNWMYDIRPSTDARPYFRDFFRIRAIPWLKEVYLDNWYQSVELGFAILLLVAIVAVTLALFFLVLPAAIRSRLEVSREEKPRGRFGFLSASVYFCAIGIGFMGIEITAITRISLYLGDPLYSATSALTCLLLGAGAGSAFAGRYRSRAAPMIRRAATGIFLYGALLFLSTFADIGILSRWDFLIRVLFTGAALLPLAFLMGFFFPLGLYLAQESSEALTPWAWAVNGFASVVAPPVVTMVAMAWDQHMVILTALAAYGLSVLATLRSG